MTKTFKSASLFYGISIIFVVSCSNTSKIIYQSKVDKIRIRFYEKKQSDIGRSLFFAKIDSNNVRINYKFFPDNIYKTYEKLDNYVYTLVQDKNPMLQLSRLDSTVFLKADQLMDSLGHEQLKRARNATGFVIEIAGH